MKPRGMEMFMVAGALLLLPACARPGDFGAYDVQRYELALRFSPESKAFDGAVTVTGTVTGEADTLAVDASLKLLTIDSVFWNGALTAYRRAGDSLLVPAAGHTGGDKPFVLRIVYHGISGFSGSYDAGGVLFTQQDGADRIATISEPSFARSWWPCHDIPSDKAIVSFAITVPSKLRAVSNGLLSAVEFPAASWTTYLWQSRYPISTYLVAFAAAEYVEMKETYRKQDGGEMPVVFYVYPSDTGRARSDFANVRKAIDFFASTFCEYPFADEKFAIAEVDGDMTMENQTLCTVQATLLTGDRNNELTFVHELAHHWWGNFVTPHDWTQTWLSEGFATYAEALYEEHTRGRAVYQAYIDNMMALPQGSYAGSVIGRSDTSFWDSFALRVYYKSAIVLHMLRSIMGDSAFFTAMRSYLNDGTLRYQTARTADFSRHCEAAHGAELGWFFDQWLIARSDSIDRPELSYTWRRQGDRSVELVLRQTTSGQLLYRLPLEIEVETTSGRERHSVVDSLGEQSFQFSTAGEPKAVHIDPEHKVFKLLKGGE